MIGVIPTIVGGAIALLMLQTGTLLDLRTVRARLDRLLVRAFCGLALVNYILIPALTLGSIFLLNNKRDLNLALLVLAALPCAPLVPALASHADESPEWPVLVFFGFSLLSLAMIPGLTAMLSAPWIGANAAPPWPGLVVAIGKYVGSVYGPLALGIGLRAFLPAFVLSRQAALRTLTSAVLALAMGLLLMANIDKVLSLTARDFLALVLFESFCVVAAAMVGIRYGGPPTTRLLSSAVRNFAMGIAFANVVLPHTDASVLVTVFSIVTVIPAMAIMAGRRFFESRGAA